jgi:cell fate regulator YaaT (PSP1 superfamily)
MSLESLYHDTNRQINEVHSKIAEVASTPANLNKQSQKEIQARIEQILR